jgi:hypothetical protein
MTLSTAGFSSKNSSTGLSVLERPPPKLKTMAYNMPSVWRQLLMLMLSHPLLGNTKFMTLLLKDLTRNNGRLSERNERLD